jgi:hypothetical protein
MVMHRGFAVAVGLVLFWGGIACADVINVMDRGWYLNDGIDLGYHDPSVDLKSYFAGEASGEYRDFFVFDLTGVTNPVVGATLELNTFEVAGTNIAGTNQTYPVYKLYDVGTAISTLTAAQTGQSGIFADLGGGTVYGSIDTKNVQSNTTITIPLTSALSAINAARGGQFAIGGTLTNTSTDPQYLFGFSDSTDLSNSRLILVTVPEPGSFVLALLGVASAFVWMRRRIS